MIERLQSKVKSIVKSVPLFHVISERRKQRRKQMRKEREIQSLIDSGLPEEMKPCLCFLVNGTSDREAEAAAKRLKRDA